MRLINADELKSKFLEMGCIDGKPCYGAEIIDRMPTVQAVPIEVLQEIRQEIVNLVKTRPLMDLEPYVKEDDVLEIIDKYKAEIES